MSVPSKYIYLCKISVQGLSALGMFRCLDLLHGEIAEATSRTRKKNDAVLSEQQARSGHSDDFPSQETHHKIEQEVLANNPGYHSGCFVL